MRLASDYVCIITCPRDSPSLVHIGVLMPQRTSRISPLWSPLAADKAAVAEALEVAWRRRAPA